MARAHLSKRLSDADAIRLFAEHHIAQVRRRKNGEIIAVKHITWGWMSPKAYYAAQEIHRILPQIVEGGYRAKSFLWGISAELTVLGSSLSLPLGMIFPLIETVALAQAINDGNVSNAAYWGYALLGPFGDALAIKAVLDVLATDANAILRVISGQVAVEAATGKQYYWGGGLGPPVG
jgi:hypothetical protein